MNEMNESLQCVLIFITLWAQFTRQQRMRQTDRIAHCPTDLSTLKKKTEFGWILIIGNYTRNKVQAKPFTFVWMNLISILIVQLRSIENWLVVYRNDRNCMDWVDLKFHCCIHTCAPHNNPSHTTHVSLFHTEQIQIIIFHKQVNHRKANVNCFTADFFPFSSSPKPNVCTWIRLWNVKWKE